MKYTLITIASLLASLSFASAQDAPTFLPNSNPTPKGKTWQLVDNMSDEFNGDTLDLTKWQAKPRGNGWMWDGRPPGLFHERNVSVSGGDMRVTVSELEKPTKRFRYQGAIVRSHHAGQLGWYFETRMKANATEMSSTFWLMTKKHHVGNKLELDIQECVGKVSPDAAEWAKNWDQVFHSNCIHRKNKNNPKQVQRQGSIPTETKNHERYYVYGAWWKSTDEVQFFLDGKYVYSIKPSVTWDVPAFIQMAIETYDWNPVPEDGGMVRRGNLEQRTTKYDWVRVWKLADQKVK